VDLRLDVAMTTSETNHVDLKAVPLMPKWSRYARQPVDVSRRRSIEIRNLSKDNDQPIVADAPPTLIVDYFLHNSEFRTAEIPLDGVTEVFGQAFNFSAVKTRRKNDGVEVIHNRHGLPKRRLPILNHVQSRFRFAPESPIRLFPLGTTDLTHPVETIDDFVYSLEVTGPKGVKFNLRDGLRGNLLSAHRMLSTQEMVFERLVVENQVVTESPPLDLTAEEKQALLLASLLRSHRAGMTEAYYLYHVCGTNNCTSSPFQILDQVVQYNLPERIGSMLYRLPLNPRFYLRVRGLDSNPNVRRIVRDEFLEYIESESTRIRKRIYVTQHNAAKRARRLESDSDRLTSG